MGRYSAGARGATAIRASALEAPVNELIDGSVSIEEEATDELTIAEETNPESIVENKPDVLTKEESVINSLNSGDCIIIVGAFGNINNVSKMLRKIEKLGMTGYQDSQLSRLTRVGVKAECNSINQSLQLVKNKIEPSAWILE